MRKFSFLIITLLLTATPAWAQGKVMQVHRGGSVVYEIPTAQVDSVTFKPEEPPVSLVNTVWKLAGIVDTQTGTVTELEPKNYICNGCYTLTFFTETKAKALDCEGKTELDLSLLGEYDITEVERITPDGEKFIRELYNPNTKTYSATSDELKIINTVEKYYFLFKPFDGKISENDEYEIVNNPYAYDIIGRWKLVDASFRINNKQAGTIDCLENDIIFDFQADDKLMVTGDILDVLYLFEYFQEGEHFYLYNRGCTMCDPGSDLEIDVQDFFDKDILELDWEEFMRRRYYCWAYLNKETMQLIGVIDKEIKEEIGENSLGIKQGDFLRSYLNLIRIRE